MTQHRVESELFALIGRIVDEDYPFLGCCYGVGTLGTVIGAVIDRTYPEPVGGMAITVTGAGRNDPLFADLPDVFDAYGGHKEAATTLPADALCLATSPQCPVQAFRVRENVYATQFHPELDLDGIDVRLNAYKNHGYFAPESADAVENRSTAMGCPASAHHFPTVHQTVFTTVTALGAPISGNALTRGNCRIRPRP